MIRIAILDDHQSTVDGYTYRLQAADGLEIVATASYADELESILSTHPVDVLLLDINVPTSAKNPSKYPILHTVPRLLQIYPSLNILIISMHTQRALIRAVMDAGASGYILKDDRDAILNLASIVQSVANGGIFYSKRAHQQLQQKLPEDSPLSQKQLEVLSLCAAFPNETIASIAKMMGVANSTARNFLSTAYMRLEANGRSGAVAAAQQLGLILPLDDEIVEK